MPVFKCRSKKFPKGRYRVGKGPCMYKSKSAADRAYRAYLAKRKGRRGGK